MVPLKCSVLLVFQALLWFRKLHIIDNTLDTESSLDWQMEDNEYEKAFSGEDVLKGHSCTLVAGQTIVESRPGSGWKSCDRDHRGVH